VSCLLTTLLHFKNGKGIIFSAKEGYTFYVIS